MSALRASLYFAIERAATGWAGPGSPAPAHRRRARLTGPVYRSRATQSQIRGSGNSFSAFRLGRQRADTLDEFGDLRGVLGINRTQRRREHLPKETAVPEGRFEAAQVGSKLGDPR